MSPSTSGSFSLSNDSTTKILSTVVCVVLAGIAITSGSIVAGCLCALVIALSYAYSPRGYIVSDRSILVRRFIGRVRIPLVGIREVRAAVPDDLRGCIRLFGNGGLFGYYGLFRTSKLGKCSWYVTNRGKAVVLITGARTAVFSPDDVDGFVAAVRSSASIPGAQWSAPAPGSTQSGPRAGRLWKPLGAAGGILVILLVAGPLLYSPGPPNYTLTSEGLTIHDRFYPVTVRARDVDVENIKIVDVGVDTEWRPTMRTNGFSNFHYHSGWYRVGSGKKVRMYRADSRRLVLLPPKGEGAPVLIEVKQPDAFIREVRQSWP